MRLTLSLCTAANPRAWPILDGSVKPDGIDLVRGTTTFNELLGLSRVMAEVAREVVVMVEADKIGRKIPNLELPWSSVHTLITDDRLPPEARDQIQARGINLICATVSQEK